ncbi:zinc ribbon domain-containing protein [Candidatus Calescamantes bacterium]|nr:zinc ribbon domain-containing protein [Candidatus Calescamantes bacterium]
MCSDFNDFRRFIFRKPNTIFSGIYPHGHCHCGGELHYVKYDEFEEGRPLVRCIECGRLYFEESEIPGNEDKFCPNCGERLNMDLCENCGYRKIDEEFEKQKMESTDLRDELKYRPHEMFGEDEKKENNITIPDDFIWRKAPQIKTEDWEDDEDEGE